jgi:excisionase family DNA binding protein
MTTRRREDPFVRSGSAPKVESELEGAADRSGRLLRPPEVARLLACSSKTVYAWASTGFLPCVRLGRLVRFRAINVRRFVEAHVDARGVERS